MKIAMSIPGVGFILAAAILAEIGNYADFLRDSSSGFKRRKAPK